MTEQNLNTEPSNSTKPVLVAVVLGNEIKLELNKIKEEIDLEYKLLYHKRFLEHTGLKVWDIVICYFSISPGNSKSSYTSSTITDGILKQYDNGILYVESIEKLSKSYSTSNGRSGRDYRSWWVFEMVNIKTDISYIQ